MEPIPIVPLNEEELLKHLEGPDNDESSELFVSICFDRSGNTMSPSCAIGLCAMTPQGKPIFLYEAAFAPLGGEDDPKQLADHWEMYGQCKEELRTSIEDLRSVGHDTSEAEAYVRRLANRQELWERMKAGRRSRATVADEVLFILDSLQKLEWKISLVTAHSDDCVELFLFLETANIELWRNDEAIYGGKFVQTQTDFNFIDLHQRCRGIAAGLGCRPLGLGAVLVNVIGRDTSCVTTLEFAIDLAKTWSHICYLAKGLRNASSEEDRQVWRETISETICFEKLPLLTKLPSRPKRKPKPAGWSFASKSLFALGIVGLAFCYYGSTLAWLWS